MAKAKRRVITHLYTDGGLVLRNPSEIGGSWAYVLTDQDDEELLRASGIIRPSDVGPGVTSVTNNYMELLAVTIGMQQLPPLWSGKILLDSHVTITRIDKVRARPSFRGVPPELEAKVLSEKARLGDYLVVLLQGHPRLAELKTGIANTGRPVSIHNKTCDYLCRGSTTRLLAEHNAQLKVRNRELGI